MPRSKTLWLISLPLIFGLAGFQCPTEPPELDEVSPRMDSRWSEVRLTGLHFGEPQGKGRVLFNGFAAQQVVSWTDTEILVRVPFGATTGPVMVETRMGMSNSVSFIVSRKAIEEMPVVKTWRTGPCGPKDLEKDDFNEDGHLDIAMTCYSDVATPEIIVALGDGAGEFDMVHIPSTTFRPYYIAMADFNNDFHLDIAYDYSGGDGLFGVILGDGQGSFGPEQTFVTEYSPKRMEAGDFDEDGNMDLVFASGYYGGPGHAVVHFGDGLGSFGESWSFEVGAQPSGVAVGDFDLDENLDLAVANSGDTLGIPDTVSILLGDGTGGFLPHHNYAVWDIPDSIITEDFNWDGNPDLAVSHDYTDVMAVLLGDGYGNFSEAEFYTTGGGAGHLNAGDLNGDGILDIALFVDKGKLGVFFGDGTGKFPVMGEVRMGQSPLPVIGDFNEDGLEDIFTGNYWSGSFSLALGDGSGGFGEASYFDVSEHPRRPQIADLNSDGWLDLVVVNYSAGSSPFSVILNDGTGSLLSPDIYDTSGIVTDVELVDMNEDDALDIVAKDRQLDRLYIFFGDGRGDFPNQTYIDAVASYLTVGDWNLDGHADTALSNKPLDSIDIYLGNGIGTLTLSGQIPACDGPGCIITDEFNGDGRPDIAVACTTPPIDLVQIFLGDGQGSFAVGELYEMPRDAASLACIDLNEDGIIDIMLSSQDGLYYLTGLGDGTFLQAELFPEAISSGHPPSAGDIDGDGHLDLVVPSGVDVVEIHWGLGGGCFESPDRYNAIMEPTASLVADFNLDGKMDILATLEGFDNPDNPYSDVAIFYGDGQRGFVDLN